MLHVRHKTHRRIVHDHEVRHKGDNFGETRARQTDANPNIVGGAAALARDSAPAANGVEREAVGPLALADFQVGLWGDPKRSDR